MELHLKKLAAILDGYKNYIFPSENIEELAKARATICSQCTFSDLKYPFKRMLKDGRTKKIEGMGCHACGCLLSAKTRTLLSDCPYGYWDEPEKMIKEGNQKIDGEKT